MLALSDRLVLTVAWTSALTSAFVPSSLPRNSNHRLCFFAAPSKSGHETNEGSPYSSPRFPIDLNEASSRAKESLQSTATEGIQSVQNAAAGLSSLEQSGRDTVQSAAGAAWSGVNQLASRGTSSIQSAAEAAGLGITGLAQAASNTAGTAGSGLVGLAQEGTSQATSLVQWLDAQAKDGAATTNAKAQGIILGFTGKSQYQFGDVSKEVLRRASSTNVDIRDVMLLLKVMLTLGATIAPLAKVLPVTVLLEALNVSLETRLGGKILEALAGAIDDRLLAAFGADELGDVAKRSLSIGIAAFTGKASYEKGDIEQAVKDRTTETTPKQPQESAGVMLQPMSSSGVAQPRPMSLNLMVSPEFAQWDQDYLQETSPADLDAVVEDSLTDGSGLSRISSEELDRQFVNELDRKFRSPKF